MGEIVKLDTEKARLGPERVFARPRDMVGTRGLTRGQKIAALERWRESLKDRLAATGEGMAPPAGDTADEAATVEEIAVAIEELSQDGDIGRH